MLTYKIHFIRHGLTQANLEGRYIGSRTDLPLCPQGKAMLEQLCEDFRYPLVERVYTSPLLRARQSAEILFPDCAIKAVENLRELDFGDFEGRTAQELEQAPDFQQWITAPPSTPTPRRRKQHSIANPRNRSARLYSGPDDGATAFLRRSRHTRRTDHAPAGDDGTATTGGCALEYRAWAGIYRFIVRTNVDARP